jgi:hypothetical protein
MNYDNKPKKKTRAEAGRSGGLAPHRCRGRGCNKNKNTENVSALHEKSSQAKPSHQEQWMGDLLKK